MFVSTKIKKRISTVLWIKKFIRATKKYRNKKKQEHEKCKSMNIELKKQITELKIQIASYRMQLMWTNRELAETREALQFLRSWNTSKFFSTKMRKPNMRTSQNKEV
jgi:hypothetical protein